MNWNQLQSGLSGAWEVLMLFLIPIGGGIPAGVLLAKHHGIGWPIMTILYFVSDVILACVFEPFLNLAAKAGKRSPFLARLGEAFRKSVAKTTAHYGDRLGPLALIAVAFGVDPMTGRIAAAAAGHGFLPGWTFAIIGDMFYYTVLMASTLWLSGILGDGTWTTLVILLLMTVVPPLIRRVRNYRANPKCR